MAVLIIFPVILQTVINVIMLSIGGLQEAVINPGFRGFAGWHINERF